MLSAPPESVLILKPSSLGDVVHTLPAVSAIRRHWPKTRLSWLVNPEWAPILEGNPDLNDVHIFPRSQFRGLTGIPRMLSWICSFQSRGQADLVLDFQCLLRSALIGKWCRKKAFLGLSDAREGAKFFYDTVAEVTPEQHAVDRYLALVKALGIPVPDSLTWNLPATPPPSGFDTSTYIVIHPFSRGLGKSMTADQLETLCKALSPNRVVIVGRSTEEVPNFSNVDNQLNKTTLSEMIAIMRQARWVISVDSGPMHIAAALNPRVLSIHTWSDPQKVGPYDLSAWIWQNGQLFQRGTPHKTVPADDMPTIAKWLLEQI